MNLKKIDICIYYIKYLYIKINMKRSHNIFFEGEGGSSSSGIKNKKNYISDKNYKLTFIGDGGIGKSTFFDKLDNLNDNDYSFPKKYKATNNFDFKRIDLKTNYGLVSIDFWDTAGQEDCIGGHLRDAYLKGTDGVLLLYDISQQETKNNVEKWLKLISNICPNIPVAVLGNKSDKLKDLQQSKSSIFRSSVLQQYYGSSNIKNFLISIKEDIHIVFESGGWFNKNDTISEKPGCLIGLEYLLTNLIGNPNIKIEY